VGCFSRPHAEKVPFTDVPKERKMPEIVGLSGEIETFGLYKIAMEITESYGLA